MKPFWALFGPVQQQLMVDQLNDDHWFNPVRTDRNGPLLILLMVARLCAQGQHGQELFIVQSGVCQVSARGVSLGYLQKGCECSTVLYRACLGSVFLRWVVCWP